LRRRRKGFSISADDARHALAILVSEGKIAAHEVTRAIGRRQKLIREIRERLEQLGAEGAALTMEAARKARPVVARTARRAARVGRKAAKAGRKRARRALSAATRAKYQAQGRYMAAVRTLPKAVRKKIREIREKSGVEAAIKAAIAAGKKSPLMRHVRNGIRQVAKA
jgi:hypothetical protein